MPASSSKFLQKSRSIKVDTVAYDLEDSVTPGNKAAARKSLRAFLSEPRLEGVGEQAVRINAVDSGYALDDLTEVVSRGGEESSQDKRRRGTNVGNASAS